MTLTLGTRASQLPATPAVTMTELPAPERSPRLRSLLRGPAWPVTALLVGYPLWWALGIADFIWIILAVPMLARMIAWRTRRDRPIKVPPGFGLWLLFMLIVVAGIAVITLTAPGTVPSHVSHRVLSYGNRTMGYFADTVLLLYSGNLTERELPRRALTWMLGLVGIFAVIGGVAGMVAPHFQFSSPFLLLLPHSFQANPFVQASTHPGFSQVQNVLGTAGGRPKAPFDYTNTWGDCLTILLPFLVAWAWTGTRRQRLFTAAVVVIAIGPLLYSLNRGAWVGVPLSIGYLAVRLAARGKTALLGGIGAVLVVSVALFAFTPLSGVITSRAHHGQSNDIRSHLDGLAIRDGLASPIIGYGDTRQERGSPTSIAVGPSVKCPTCGQLAVGSTGQLWLLLVCDGIVGAAMYVLFFGYGVWRFRRDFSPFGVAGGLALLLSFWYLIAYDATGAPLGFTMLAYAVLWKNDTLSKRSADPPGPTRPVTKPPPSDSGPHLGSADPRLGPNGQRLGLAGLPRVTPWSPSATAQPKWPRAFVASPPAAPGVPPVTGASPSVTAGPGSATTAPSALTAPQTQPTAELDGEQDDFFARTVPMPAIDIAGFEAQPTAVYEDTTRKPRDAAAGTPGLAGVARGGAVNLAGAVISAAGSVGLTVLVTRSFPQSAVGTFFVAMSLFLIAEAIINLGAYNGAIYFIARLRALNAERRIPAIIRATVVPVAVASVIGAAALVVFVHPITRLLLNTSFSGHVSAGALATALRVLAVALPFAALTDTMLGATRGYHEMRPTVLVDRIGRSTLQVLGVALAAVAGSAALLAPLWALPYLPVAIIATLWLRRIVRRQQAEMAVVRRSTTMKAADQPKAAQRPADHAAADNRHGKPNARGFWKFTAPRSLASLAQIVVQRADIILVGVLKGPIDAAIYTAATRFLVAGQLGNAAISMAAQPQLTRLFAVRDLAGANTVYQVTTAWLILLTWPLYLLAAVFGPTVLRIFGPSYQAGSTVMIILALTMLVATACGQVDMVLITTGRSSWSLYNGLLAMGVNIGVDLVLIPRFGITGAAIGWAAAICMSNLVPLAQVAVAAKVHPFGKGMAAASALTVLSFAVIPLALRAVAGPGSTTSITAIALGGTVMALGLWLLHQTLHLSAMPGMSRLASFARPGPPNRS